MGCLIGIGIGLFIFLFFIINFLNKDNENNSNPKKEAVQIKNKKEDITLSRKPSNNVSSLKVPDDLYFYNFPIPSKRYSLSNGCLLYTSRCV